MVMAQSLFIALKQASPDVQIDVLAPSWSLALLERMPEVHKAIAMPLGHGQLGLAARYQLGKSLQPKAYQQAIVLPNSWKSALVPFFAGIPLRTGYWGECRWGLLSDPRKLDKSLLTMTVQRFVALAGSKTETNLPEYRFPKLFVSANGQQRALQKFQLTQTDKILAFCPGAEFGPAKRWPASHFAAVAMAKLNQGWQIWLFGSTNDQAVTSQINDMTGGRCIDLAGHTSLGEAIDLLSAAYAVVSNDSGLMHVAAALNKKIVALYGSSDAKFTPPLINTVSIVSLGLDCSPCFKRVCPLYPPDHDQHTACLVGISPDVVLKLLPE